MKQVITILLLLLFFIPNAQTDSVQLGMANASLANPLYSPVFRNSLTNATTHARSNILFTQAELMAQGLPAGASITAIKFRKTVINTMIKTMDYKIYMANSSRTLLNADTWASIRASHTMVYSNPFMQVPVDSGWVTWNLTPFIYTGGALEMATEQQMEGNGGASSYFSWRVDGTVAVNLIEGQVGVGSFPDTLNGTNANWLHRPNTRIIYTVNALPVQLLSFTANRQAKDILLNWTVGNETNLQDYVLERSTNGSSFSSIGKQDANNSSSYQAKDNNAPNTLLYYRLKMLEKDGSSNYSKAVLVKPMVKGFEASIQSTGLLQVQPMKAGKLIVQLFMVDGKLLHRMEQPIQTGNNQLWLPIDGFVKGCYLVHLQLAEETQVLKLMR